ncbi:PDR/VanB family oxidoreductase [Nocardia rhamnosiphila]|uniref:PDR/VanB family oxidoreductase n=1 Tax=Nocardia rhamnosiphila TaxID=426716 RepID=A0ABV2X253_9NOCA
MDNTYELVVRERTQEASDVVSLVLEAPGRKNLPAWEPGAHIDVCVGDGTFRQYSLCGERGELSSYQIAVLLDRHGRGGSQFVHDRLEPGSVILVRGPRNQFALTEAERYNFVAGGVGITPILPMAEQLSDEGKEFSLFYGGRTLSSMAFLERVESLKGDVHVFPQDEHGLLPLDEIVRGVGEGTVMYSCGPAVLLDRLKTYPSLSGRLRIERFEASATGPSSTVDKSADSSFEVFFERSDKHIVVPPDQTVLTAGRAAGIDLPYDCTEGFCGACQVRVLSGEIDHRDEVLTPEEKARNEIMLVCCSRSQNGRIVLDH